MRTRQGLGGLVLAAILASPVLAGIGLADEPLAFAPVPDARPSVDALARRAPRLVLPDAGRTDVSVVPQRTAVRPFIRLPANPARVVVRSTGSGNVIGTASWYCGHGSRCTAGYPSGLYAAAGPGLRVGDWRGRTVLVSANGRRVYVRLIDWCACPQRALDLYRDAFSRLADPSRGLIRVTVSW
jgi:hypothetical protein